MKVPANHLEIYNMHLEAAQMYEDGNVELKNKQWKSIICLMEQNSSY